MSTRQFVGQMKSQIEDIKMKGTTAIDCDNLIAYLSEAEKLKDVDPTAIEIEMLKANLQYGIEFNKHTYQERLEMFKSVIVAGQGAINSSLLLNGGAAVAVLAFISRVAESKPTKVPLFGDCLLGFAFGVLAIAMASGFTYLSQWLYASPYPWAQKSGFGVNVFAILLGLTSYGLFAWGLFAAYRVLAHYS